MITPEQNAKYLESPDNCPHCGSQIIRCNNSDFSGSFCTRYISCDDCEKEWEENFTMTSITDQNDDTNHGLSRAWEVTVDDIYNVLKSNHAKLSEYFIRFYGKKEQDLMFAADRIFDTIFYRRANEIAEAALCGNDMEQQTIYANEKLVSMLTEMGILCT